jgi:hypothetical protein
MIRELTVTGMLLMMGLVFVPSVSASCNENGGLYVGPCETDNSSCPRTTESGAGYKDIWVSLYYMQDGQCAGGDDTTTLCVLGLVYYNTGRLGPRVGLNC